MTTKTTLPSSGAMVPVIITDDTSGTNYNLDLATELAARINQVATRTAMAAVPGSAGLTRYLTESGREGLFVFLTAAQILAQFGITATALVTADPSQGVCVAPSTDTTGASGAWVRKFSGSHNVKWFGATGDGTTNDGAAVLAALAYLGATSQSGFGYSSSASELFFPKGHYFLGTNTLELTYTTILTGEGTGGAGGAASLLRWAANTTGIRVQRANTTGATAVQASSGHGGDGSIIRNLYLKGAYSSAEGEYHGIHLRATASIRDCFIELFQGDAIYVKATIGGGAGSEGAANLIDLNRVFVQSCRNGLYIEGADANAGTIVAFSAIACRQWGIWDKSFLGNSYYGCHAAANSRNSINNGSTLACSYVSQGGNRYTVIRGQEVGASTNAPSGAATDNTWWYYKEAGAADAAGGCPAWGSGITVRAGGGYLGEGLSSNSNFHGCYAEIDQVSQIDQCCLWTGGNHFGTLKGTSSAALIKTRIIAASSSGIVVGSDHRVAGDTYAQGLLFVTGAAQFSSTITIPNDVAGSLTIGRYSAGIPNAYIIPGSTANALVLRSPDNTDAFSITNTGVTVTDSLTAAGVVSTAAVTSSSATAGIGYATGAGGTVTQITSRTTGVQLDKICGAITLFSAAGTATWQTFTVTNSTVAATDVIRVVQKSGTDLNMIHVTNVAAGSFKISFATTGGVTVEQPVFNFAVVKAVAA